MRIIRRKLEDIDWRKGEIRFVQKKTGITTSLPLMNEAGKALQDYILNARPSSNLPEVFLSAKAPTRAHMNAASIFIRYQKKARINRVSFEGKDFHGLRGGSRKR